MPPVGQLSEPVLQLIHSTLPAFKEAIGGSPDRLDEIIAAFIAAMPQNPAPTAET